MNSSTKIRTVHARQVMDCNFRPVLEVDVVLESGVRGRGAAPTGNSVGLHEAAVLRDNDPARFCGLSVFRAADNVNRVLGPAIAGMDVMDQEAVDRRMIELDGMLDKSRLGGNAVYSVSIACAQAAARAQNVSLYRHIAGGTPRCLPLPVANSILGGRYPDRTVCFQEFSFCPYKAANMEEAMEIIFHVHREIGTIFTREQGGVPAQKGNGHGWKPPTEDPEAIMQMLEEAVRNCGFSNKVAFVLDMASSEMYNKENKTYYMNGRNLTADEQIAYTKRLTEKYDFLFIEDVLDQDDWEGHRRARREISRTALIGDDLIVSNRRLLRRACEEEAVEGFIFKPNQVGTITEAVEARSFAREHGMMTVPSQRGGGTIWDVVIDLAVGLSAEACKSCAPRGGESVYAMNCLYRAADEYPEVPLADLSPWIRF